MTLAAQILGSFERRDDWWFPNLAAQLAHQLWREIGTPTFSSSEYGTERYLAARGQLSCISQAPPTSSRRGLIEHLGPALSRHYETIGMDAASGADLPMNMATRRLNGALAIIGHAPGLLASVRELVLAVHPLRAPSPDIDIGYSDPAVPFSIFVSIPDSCCSVSLLRLAEGIVHEAMHLQLTLIEREVPLVAREKTCWHSPWRDEQRPIGGILHGAYVFAVVRCFLTRLLDLEVLDAPSRAHAEKRRRQIDEELAEVSWLSDCGELTPAGRSFAKALMSDVRTGAPRQLPPACPAPSSGTGFAAR